MKISIGKTVICGRSRLRKKLQNGARLGYNKTKPALYGYVLGCYDSHWFGICVYRNSAEAQRL